MAETLGERGVDDEMVADGFEAEHCPQEKDGVPVDQAWGLQAVGYWTGYLVRLRS